MADWPLLGGDMGITIKDCHFESNGVGIKAPTSADLSISGTTFHKNGKAMDLYVSPQDYAKLGLPHNTPAELLTEAVADQNERASQTHEERLEVIKKSRLFEWLEHSAGFGASLVTIADAVVKFISN